MNSNKLDVTDVVNLLDVIIGETNPWNEDNTADVFFNIKDTISVVDYLLERLETAAKCRHNIYQSDSMRQCGEEAYAAILNWKDWCARVEEELG